jgi:hypothetical protein
MFQFPALATIIIWTTVLQTAGLSHSETRGSKVMCTYPRLIAAYHVLHSLNEPRHPPYALSYFPCDNPQLFLHIQRIDLKKAGTLILSAVFLLFVFVKSSN